MEVSVLENVPEVQYMRPVTTVTTSELPKKLNTLKQGWPTNPAKGAKNPPTHCKETHVTSNKSSFVDAFVGLSVSHGILRDMVGAGQTV